MKFLIIGAGTIGLTYAWLLEQQHEVTVLVRPERLEEARAGYTLELDDLRDKQHHSLHYTPALTTQVAGDYDAVLVMVNRTALAGLLPGLAAGSGEFVFMLNHWDIESEVSQYLPRERYLYGFPSQVGGGREAGRVEAIIFGEGTVLGEADGADTPRLRALQSAFEKAGLAVEVKTDILDWLCVHYLQQSISAGGILQAGSYGAFAGSYRAVKGMVLAFREGVAVCAARGVNTKHIFPASMFRYPAPLVTLAMKGMFKKPETAKMVTGHMKQGLPEWVAGYYEVLATGEELGVPMPVWNRYRPSVDAWQVNNSPNKT